MVLAKLIKEQASDMQILHGTQDEYLEDLTSRAAKDPSM